MAIRKTMLTISQMRRRNPQILSSDIAKMHIDSITRYAVDNINEVKARIHRIVLFCPKDKRPQGKLDTYFKRKFENVQNIPKVSKERLKGYRNQLDVTNNICTIHIFINRVFSDITGYFPAFRMEIIPNEKTSAKRFRFYLAKLNELIANLHPTEIEYTLDLFCEKQREVESLFLMVRRSLYVPYKNNPKLYDNYSDLSDEDEEEGENENGERMNSSFYAANGVKIYERGNDDKKEKYLHKSGKTKKGWRHDNINRLRLEHTADRTKLRNHCIDTLSDFIINCKFYEMNKGIFQFKCFMAKSLPKYWLWPSYSTTNEQGCKGAFQIEYVYGKHVQTNIRQYMKDIKEFGVLRERLIQQMLDFDSVWGKAT
jgi:hypothetical protein